MDEVHVAELRVLRAQCEERLVVGSTCAGDCAAGVVEDAGAATASTRNRSSRVYREAMAR